MQRKWSARPTQAAAIKLSTPNLSIMISLQFYTIRDAFSADPVGTLERVAEIGYPGIEIGGYNNKDRDALVAKINELGLTVTGAHVGVGALQNDFAGVVAENRALNNKNIIVPYLGEQYRGSLEKLQQTGALLKELAHKTTDEGFTLSYHNHDFELTEQHDGKTALEIILDCAPSVLQSELDVYWVKKGGKDPVEFINKFADRLSLLHVKDMMPDGSFGEVGEGILDWPAIFAAAAKTDVLHYVVEQDQCPGDPFDSITTSFDNLKQMGIA